MSAAFRGPSRGLGIELYRGTMAYLESVNQAGGVGDRKVVVKAYDDGYNPDPAIANTVRLIERDHVLLLYGYVGTPTVTRVLPLLKRYSDRSAYLFFPFTGAEPQRRPPYDSLVFNLRASYGQETEGLVDNFLGIGRTRVAVFYQIDAYGRSGWDGVRRGLAKHGLKMVGEATYKRGTGYDTTMRPQVDILRGTDPEVIISVGSYAACAALVRDARDAGWDVPIANVSFVGSENLLALLSETGRANGKDYTANLVNSQVVPSYHDLDLRAVREYRELMSRYDPLLPAGLTEGDYRPLPYSFVGFEGFLDAKLLVEVLRRMGDDIRPERIQTAAESIDDFDLGIDARVSFRPRPPGEGWGYRRLGLNRIYYTEVKEGRFVPLADWGRWRR
jgi:ABC-type branched-subunit amino acid transport system substrate-binding protein